MTKPNNNLIIEVKYDQLNDDYKTKFLNNNVDSNDTEYNLLNTKTNKLAIYDKDVQKINIEWEKPTEESISADFQIKTINFLKKQNGAVVNTSKPLENYTTETYDIKNQNPSQDSVSGSNDYTLRMVPQINLVGGTAKKTRIKRKKTKLVKRAKTLRGKSRNLLRS